MGLLHQFIKSTRLILVIQIHKKKDTQKNMFPWYVFKSKGKFMGSIFENGLRTKFSFSEYDFTWAVCLGKAAI